MEEYKKIETLKELSHWDFYNVRDTSDSVCIIKDRLMDTIEKLNEIIELINEKNEKQ